MKLSFFAFVAFAFAAVAAEPQQPDPKTVLALVLSDIRGNPVANASFEVSQYTPETSDHPSGPTIREMVKSDATGRLEIATTPFREVAIEFRVSGFRPARAKFDRAYKRVLEEGQFDFTWAFREPKEGGDTGEIRSQFSRDASLTVSLLLPAARDDDREFETKLRALLPPEKPLPRR